MAATDTRGRAAWRAGRATWAISIYGTISVAVVVAEYAAASAARLTSVVLGYGVSLWLAHAYAGVVSGTERGWSSSLRHSWPVAEAAAPALVVTALTAVLGGSNRVAVPLALAACLGNLLAVQVAVLRGAGQRMRGRVLATAVLDVLAGVVVLLVLTLLK